MQRSIKSEYFKDLFFQIYSIKHHADDRYTGKFEGLAPQKKYRLTFTAFVSMYQNSFMYCNST